MWVWCRERRENSAADRGIISFTQQIQKEFMKIQKRSMINIRTVQTLKTKYEKGIALEYRGVKETS